LSKLLYIIKNQEVIILQY